MHHTVPNILNLHQQPVDAVVRPTFIWKLCYKLPSILTFTFVQTFDQNVVFFTEWRHVKLTGSMTRNFQNSRYFAVSALEEETLIKKSKPVRKMKHANSILEYFEYFCRMLSKLILIVFELYRFKVGAFFETQCRWTPLYRPIYYAGTWLLEIEIWSR